LGNYILIAATLALTVFGQLIIKARAEVHAQAAAGLRLDYLQAMFLDPLVWAGLMGAVLASVCWMLAIRAVTLGFAYPFMALSFVLVPLGARVFFGEPFGWKGLLSLSLIVAGVALNANLR
jgi:drug/metabolite transporter (DMT)-like permease